MELLVILTAIACTLLFPYAAIAQLDREDINSGLDISIAKFSIAAFFGATIGVLCSWYGELPTHMDFLIVIISSLLAMGAWIDRVSGWAPDIVIAPLCLMSFLFTPEISSLRDLGVLLASGVCLYIVSILLWAPQALSGYRFATPPDFIALGLPFVLFGITMQTVAVFLTVSFLLILCLKFEFARNIFAKPVAVLDARSHSELEEKPAITFLSVIFPVILLAMIFGTFHIFPSGVIL